MKMQKQKKQKKWSEHENAILPHIEHENANKH